MSFRSKFLQSQPRASEARTTGNQSRSVLSLKKKGRPFLWHPKKVTKSDSDTGRSILAEYGACTTTRDRIRRFFLEFLEINKLEPSASCVPLIGQMCSMGCSYGTIDSYLNYISTFFRGPDRGRFLEIKRAIELAHADSNPARIHFVTLKEIEEIISNLSIKNVPLAAHVFMMASTGGRSKDISRLRRCQIDVSPETLTTEFRVTKTRRKRALRYCLKQPRRYCPQAPPKVISYLMEGDKEERIFTLFSNSSVVCSALKEHHTSKKITTKSIRRNYIRRVLARTGGNLAKTKELTGHFRESTIQAFYEEWSGNKSK